MLNINKIKLIQKIYIRLKIKIKYLIDRIQLIE